MNISVISIFVKIQGPNCSTQCSPMP